MGSAGAPPAVAVTEEDSPLSRLLAYLQRIKYGPLPASGELPPATLETLTQLHRLHVTNIPFENLIFVHHRAKGTERPIDLDSLHRRIVLRRRGGMCQEMNKLFRHHITQLGFDCYSGIAAVVLAGSQKPAPQPLAGLVTSTNLGATQRCDGTHQIIFVRLGGGATYLCDVGLGGFGLTEPLLLRAYDDADATGPSGQAPPEAWLAAKGEALHSGVRVRLRRGVVGSSEPLSTAQAMTHPERESFVGWYVQAHVNDAWVDQYWFSQVPTTDAVLLACSDYSFRHHPLFTTTIVVTRPLDSYDGRASLTGFTLKIRREGQPTEARVLQDEAERDAVLAGPLFGIDLEAYP